METEFDKEIDILLRQSSLGGGLAAELVGRHLEADEINAFAENALSEKLRLRAMEHFADCSRCRKILSNLAVFNAEDKSEIVHAEESKTIAAVTEIPWYKKLFMFPQIAYSMGALALIFGGIIAVIVLKDASQNYSSDVAKMEKTPENPSVFSADSVSNSNATANYSNSANAAANVASAANSNTTTASANKIIPPESSANSVLSETGKSEPKPGENPSDDAKNETKEKKDEIAAAPTPAPPAPAAKPENMTVDGVTTDADVAKRQTEDSRDRSSRNQAGNLTRVMPDSQNAQNQRQIQNLPMTARRAEEEATVSADSAAKTKSVAKPAENKSIGGKNFRRSDGVWYDVNYKGQKTINIRRSSDEYKKLDANIRSIADNLGGVVVIVSGSKAYRIQ